MAKLRLKMTHVLDDLSRQRWPTFEKVREVIHSDRCLTVQEVADELGISKTLCHEILTENLGM
jgi:response regulator of citrate/malate metabolism